MRAFFDTSVLVAAFLGDHPHHDASAALFRRFAKDEAGCAAHTLAEVYATLTRLPGRHRISGEQTMLFLETIRERLTVVTLTAGEYHAAIEAASAAGVTGGGIYDALLARCALKTAAKALYTWNAKHFRCLGPEVAPIVRTP